MNKTKYIKLNYKYEIETNGVDGKLQCNSCKEWFKEDDLYYSNVDGEFHLTGDKYND